MYESRGGTEGGYRRSNGVRVVLPVRAGRRIAMRANHTMGHGLGWAMHVLVGCGDNVVGGCSHADRRGGGTWLEGHGGVGSRGSASLMRSCVFTELQFVGGWPPSRGVRCAV